MEEKKRRRPRRYTVKQTAERMGYSESFVRDLIDSGELQHLRRKTKAGSSIRIRERDIEKWEGENVVCPGLNSKEQLTDSQGYPAEINGTSPGPKDGDQSVVQPAQKSVPTPSESLNDGLQSKLGRLAEKKE